MAIEALQIALEEGAAKELELRRARQHAEQWRNAMLAESWQQRREHLRLRQRSREEDLWLGHLQAKADGLVEELLVLEGRLAGAHAGGVRPAAAEPATTRVGMPIGASQL